jgi:hypothetical protein
VSGKIGDTKCLVEDPDPIPVSRERLRFGGEHADSQGDHEDEP